MAFIDEMTAEDRAGIYELLAEAFGSAPTEESTNALCHVARALGVRCPDGTSLGEIQREFMDLLVVPNPRYVAPYESAYRDSRISAGPNATARPSAGLLMGDSTLAVRQAFNDAGVMPSRDLPDHIANELRLVGHLWHVEAHGDAEDANEAGRQRRCFVPAHPLRWIEELGGRIGQGSATGFYRAVVETARALLDAESTCAGLERADEMRSGPAPVEP